MDLQKIPPTQWFWLKIFWKEQDTPELHLYPRQWYIVRQGGHQKEIQVFLKAIRTKARVWIVPLQLWMTQIMIGTIIQSYPNIKTKPLLQTTLSHIKSLM